MDHLTRIFGDMTNSIERLCTQWKEKSLTIVAGPYTEYKNGDVVEITSNNGRRWVWRAVEGMEARGSTRVAARRPACGTESPKQTPCLCEEGFVLRFQTASQEADSCLFV